MSHKDPQPILVIEANRIQKEYLKDLFRHRELFYFFAWRDIVVRYKQAVFGVAWALLRPLLNMAIFSFIFGYIAKLPSDNVNYPIFVLAGMLPWQLFANALVDTCNCLVGTPQLLTKTYFPRMIVPSAQIIVHLVDFGISLLLLLGLGLWFWQIDFITLLTLPLFVLLALFLCLGSGLWISALTVKYRDFRFIVPFVAQFGIFLSPVAYGSFLIPERWQWLYALNPMVGIINGFRWAFFGISSPHMESSLFISFAVSMLIFVTGFRYFRKTERTFADQI
jgi:lipopolysaccharide transport system permease protein